MKIIMLGHKRIPSREGGIEVVVYNLAKALIKRGNEITAFNRYGNSVADDESIDVGKEFEGIRIKQVFTFKNKSLNAFVYSFNAGIKAAFSKCDIIHYHAEGSCAFAWIPKLFGKKVVATVHGLDWSRSKWGGFATKYLKFAEKMAVKYADEIIVLSKNVSDYFKDTYNRDTIVIPNGVEQRPAADIGEAKKKWGLEEGGYILFLARIVPEKGLHYLLDAYKEIDTDLKLVVVGGPSHSEEYYNEMKKKAAEDSRVVFTGYLSGGEILASVQANCAIYCLPSDIEGMPLSLIEELAYDRRVLVSDIPENTEHAGDFVRTFKHGDVKDLKEKLTEMINLGYEVNEGAGDYVRENFSWDTIAQKTEEVYKKVLNR